MTNGGTLTGMEIGRDPFPPRVPPGQDQLPWDDGVEMETPRHRALMNQLIDTLAQHWADREDFFVGGNMFVYFSELQTRKNDFRGPDVFVVLGTDRKKHRKSWVLWEEGGKFPDVVIELTSPSTKTIDHEEKLRLYERIWSVSTYVIFDPHTLELTAYHRDATGFVRDETDRGVIHVPCMGLSLAIAPTRLEGEAVTGLRWLQRGVPVPTREERTEHERERADAERQRADQEHARAEAQRERAEQERLRAEEARARAEEARVRAEQEHARAERERAQAAHERERADAERTRAEAAERRVRDLEALLAKK
jgi:Uma2 family endonuclease